jgi:hypothetical protein
MPVRHAGPPNQQLAQLQPLTVTVATAKKLSGLGHTTIWGLIKRQTLEVVHVGRRTLVVYRSLEELLLPPRPLAESPPKPVARGPGAQGGGHDKR